MLQIGREILVGKEARRSKLTSVSQRDRARCSQPKDPDRFVIFCTYSVIRYIGLLFFLFTPLFASQICFIYAHPAPRQHFEAFQAALQERGVESDLFSLEQWEEHPSNASIVITEGGDRAFAQVHRALEREGVFHYVYYDNPESYVPGGYSEAIGSVLKEKIDGVLFANANLAEQKIFRTPSEEIILNTPRFGIGYYPLDAAKRLLALCQKKEELRRFFFAKHNLEDQSQPLLVYLGGANQVYYEEALPYFLQLLSHPLLKDYTIVMQPHPRDRRSLEGKKNLVISTEPFLEALAMADAILYYQSSAIPLCILAHIQAIQVASTPFEDLLVRQKIVESVDSAEALTTSLGKHPKSDDLLEILGYRENWLDHLLEVFWRRG